MKVKGTSTLKYVDISGASQTVVGATNVKFKDGCLCWEDATTGMICVICGVAFEIQQTAKKDDKDD